MAPLVMGGGGVRGGSNNANRRRCGMGAAARMRRGRGVGARNALRVEAMARSRTASHVQATTASNPSSTIPWASWSAVCCISKLKNRMGGMKVHATVSTSSIHVNSNFILYLKLHARLGCAAHMIISKRENLGLDNIEQPWDFKV